MEKIYRLLLKHFLQEASPEEELIIGQFKKEHPLEYNTLKSLWLRKGTIEIKNFDNQKAWNIVKQKMTSKQKNTAKIIPFYRKFQNIAAAIILLILATTAFFYLQKTPATEVQIAQIESTQQAQELRLSDGTKIWLNSKAKISYPQEFQGDTRSVKLEGEAFFEVAKNPDKPFIITTRHSSIQVLGTSFNVNNEKEKTTISVKTGKVEVTSSFIDKKVILAPRQSAIVNNETITKHPLNNENYLAWKTGIFNFTDSPLSDVIRDLNTYFSGKFILNKQDLDCRFNGQFNQLSADEVAKILQRSCDITITDQQGQLVIE